MKSLAGVDLCVKNSIKNTLFLNHLSIRDWYGASGTALLWVVDSSFTDWRAIPYIISNIVVITSITVLMNIFLERYNNLIYSVLMHFGFNIIYVFLDVDIRFFVILTVLHLIITPIAVLIRNKSVKNLPF